MAGYDPEATGPGDETLFSSGLFGIDAAVGEAPVTLGYTTAPKGGVTEATLARLGYKQVPVTPKLIEAAQGFYKLPEDQIAELQHKLYAGHFYSDDYYSGRGKTPAYGVADEDSYSAWKRALIRAARSGQPIGDVLGAAGAAGVAAGPVAEPLVIQLTSPTDLRAIYEAASIKLTGRKPAEGDVTAFIAEQQATEMTAQQAAYKAGGAGLPGGPGGTVTRPPSPEAAATAEVRQRQPGETGAHDLSRTFDMFLSLLGGIGGQGQ